MSIIFQTADVRTMRDVIRHWISLLAASDYQGAVNSLCGDASAKVVYDADVLKHAIGNYSPDYREASPKDRDAHIPAVTAVSELKDVDGENMVIFCKGGEHPIVEYDLPIEGKWSDLTAKFLLKEVKGGYCLALYDILVL